MMINQYFFISLSIITGFFIGNIKIKNFKLGASASLFTGLIISFFIIKYLYSDNFKNIELVSKDIFIFSLLLFLSSVGIMAGKDISKVLKNYSYKFIIIGFTITFTGMSITIILSKLFNLSYSMANGIFTGSLTSSPGFASAIEVAQTNQDKINTGIGYSFSYIPGVLSVILPIYLFPILFRINIKKETELFMKEFNETNKINNSNINKIEKFKTQSFNIAIFWSSILLGIIIGKIDFAFFIKNITLKLGITGGVLISSLLTGYICEKDEIKIFKKKLNIKIKFSHKILNSLKSIGLYMFLSSIGLMYGYKTISSIQLTNIIIILNSFIVALISIFSGFFLGRKIFKLNWILLAGGLTGGMTSTPGLGSAIESTSTEKVIIGYGATYPFALIFMIIFTKLIKALI